MTGMASREATGDRVLWGLELTTLWTFAVAQPLLSLLGDNPEFFIAHDVGSAGIVLFAFGLALLPPAVLALGEAVVALWSPHAAWLLHLGLVGVLAAAVALLVAAKAGASGALAVPLAVAVGAGAAVGRARVRDLGLLLRALSPAAVLFCGLFLLSAETRRIAFPDEEPQARVASAAAAATPRAPVVFVVLDQLPVTSLLDERGRVDAERFPGFAKLARVSTFHPRVAAVANTTVRAVPAVVTGVRPGQGLLPVAADHPDSLFTWLAPTHDLHVREQITQLCPSRACPREREDRGGALLSDVGVVLGNVALPDDLQGGLPDIDTGWGDFGDEATAEPAVEDLGTAVRADRLGRFTDFVDGIEAGGRRPGLWFAHVLLPHFPFVLMPSGRRVVEDEQRDFPGLSQTVWTGDPLLPAITQQRHLLQLQATDRVVGRLVDRLRKEGLLRRAAIVLTADHGISFRPGQPIGMVSQGNVADQAGVPLFVKRPGQRRARVDTRLLQTTDVLPTLAAALGTRLPWRADGRAPASARHVRLRINDRELPPYPFSVATFRRGLDSALRRRHALLGSGDPRGIFALGRPEVLGRPAAEFPALDARIDQAGQLAALRGDARTIPALLSGAIVGGASPGGELVGVAVAGRVVAVSRTFDQGGERRFLAPIPEASLREGANDVMLVRLDAAAGGG